MPPLVVLLIRTAPAPMMQSGATFRLLLVQLFTPKKQFSPTVQNPEMATCMAKKQFSPTCDWCPIELPVQTVMLSPILTPAGGWCFLV
jgi:hypothetical protein